MHIQLIPALLLVVFFFLQACTHQAKPLHANAFPSSLNQCHLVIDAGSSGTRIYLYELGQNGWITHKGPKSSALANPIRQADGDIPAAIDSTVAGLEASIKQFFIKSEDEETKSADSAGEIYWLEQCDLHTANVLATAGMRIAEKEDPASSRLLWEKLGNALKDLLPSGTEVNTRTMTGFEEGLFSMLAARYKTGTNKAAIVEIGGASLQVTFPCPTCKSQSDAVRTVLVDGKPTRIFSYSFLGLGLNEAPKVFGIAAQCSYGVGLLDADWNPAMCADSIILSKGSAVLDPYNHTNDNKTVEIPTALADADTWFLLGGFNYMDAENLEKCCMSKGKCYKKETSCFRENYLPKLLSTLQIPESAQKLKTNWALGAAICLENSCLEKAAPLTCRWTGGECL